jgi:hypothetical protein
VIIVAAIVAAIAVVAIAIVAAIAVVAIAIVAAIAVVAIAVVAAVYNAKSKRETQLHITGMKVLWRSMTTRHHLKSRIH